jgi:hypothetical protein
MLHAMRHRDQRWLARAIALIVLLGALAPTVSRWLHHGGAGAITPLALLEVCMTREGGPSTIVTKQVANTPLGERNAPAGEVHVDHCPFCLMHGDGHGMAPPSALAALPPSRLSHALPSLFLSAPRPLNAWATALARAPPSMSA